VTTSAELLDLVVAALRVDGATVAGSRVYRPGDRPTQNDQYPNWRARVVRESKQSLGRGGGPAFTVTTTIRLIGEVSVGDAGAAEAEAELWRMQREAEVAIVGSYLLTTKISQIASIDSQLSYNSDGETHLAGIQCDLALEFYQGPEDFAPTESDDLNEIDGRWPAFPPTGFTADLTR
jgi:hypothetical protein